MKYRKKYIIVLLILTFIIFDFIYLKISSDGMQNIKEVKVYYKTYSKGKKYVKWIKNGKTSGNKKDSIGNISIKIKNKTKSTGDIVYRLYTEDGKWTKELKGESNLKNKKINGIRINTNNELHMTYDICYRTYNEKDKWFQWACNGDNSGNAKENITAIEIKLIPRGVVKHEYLKDYDESKKTNINFD